MAMPLSLTLLAPFPPTVFADRFPEVEVAVAHDGVEAVRAASGATVCVADYRGVVKVDEAVAAALAPTCRLVQVPAAGLDGVDLDACRRHGIPVAGCAGLNAASVAEWCVYGIIDALRTLSASGRALRDGRWEQLDRARFELAGRRVGIVGLGAIGTAVAERLQPFGVDLRYWTRHRRSPEEETRLSVTWSALDDLVADVNVLVLAVALADATRGLLSADRIATMREQAVVVNAARGEIVDEVALAAALAEGRLHGAALDTFVEEPLPADHPLLDVETASLTPHVGGATVEAVTRILGRVMDNVDAALHGREPAGLV